MLTGNLVRVRYGRDLVIPVFIQADDPVWLEVAETLLANFRASHGRTRGELEDEIRETFGADPSQLVHQGLAKLLEDRCAFEVVSGQPPEMLREAVFQAAAERRRGPHARAEIAAESRHFDRAAVLSEVARRFDLTVDTVDSGLFADLRSEQRLVRFKDITPQRLLERYNVALAQAVLLRSTSVDVKLRQVAPPRLRRILRAVKFHRLICEVSHGGDNEYRFRIDGPLSLFSATQKYGLQLALFFPALLHCQSFDLRAELHWGPQRRPKQFFVTERDGLVPPSLDTADYVPAELAMFVDLFRQKIADWEISNEVELFPLGEHMWVPDFRLIHRATGRAVYLDVLGFWRRSGAEKHLERLRQHARAPFLLAVSDQLHIDDAELEALPAEIHRFRQMPLPEEVVRRAEAILG